MATPWSRRRFDKSDFNDLIRREGPAAVVARIELALSPRGPQPPGNAALPADLARHRLEQVVKSFFNAARRFDPEAALLDGLGEAVKRGVKGIGGGLAGTGFQGAVQAGQVSLGIGQQGQRVAAVVVGAGGQLGTGADDDAAGVLLLQDAAMGFKVGGRVDAAGEAGHEVGAAGAVQGAAVAQLGHDGEQVGVVALLH